jgi:hypothetical protein
MVQTQKYKCIIETHNEEEMKQYIEKHLTIHSKEKNKYGEVFTPSILIDEFYNNLPQKIWKNPYMKWLEPSCGRGNFFVIAYYRLMKGLENWEPNEFKRRNHIIQNMLHMVEINPKNVKILKDIFGNNANIHQENFLTYKNTEKYDIIIGNPPYQEEKTEKDQRKGGHGIKILWDKFIVKSLDQLSEKGYLCFITPAAWRKPQHYLYKKMTKENKMVYLHIYGKEQGKKIFNILHRFDMYIIQNVIPDENYFTTIIDELDQTYNIKWKEWPFIPNYYFEEIKKILIPITHTTQDHSSMHPITYQPKQENINIIYSSSLYDTRKLKENKTKEYKYPVVHSINKSGVVYWYTNDNTKGHFHISKVLLNFNMSQYPINDYEGKYGMSQLTFGIPIQSKKEGDEIIKAINSEIFKEIIKATKWGVFQTDWRMFLYFRNDFYKLLKREIKTKTNSQKIHKTQKINKTQKIYKIKKYRHNKTKRNLKEI